MVEYIRCELILDVYTLFLFIAAVHYPYINICYVLLLVFTVPMYTMLSTTK